MLRMEFPMNPIINGLASINFIIITVILLVAFGFLRVVKSLLEV
jgi:hypothetical protein